MVQKRILSFIFVVCLLSGFVAATHRAQADTLLQAAVCQHLQKPVIIFPQAGQDFNKETIAITGVADPSTTIVIENNGQASATTIPTDRGIFAVEFKIAQGKNVLAARATDACGQTMVSHAVIVTRENPKHASFGVFASLSVAGLTSITLWQAFGQSVGGQLKYRSWRFGRRP